MWIRRACYTLGCVPQEVRHVWGTSLAVSGQDTMLPLQRARVQSLVGELRSCMLHRVARKQKKKKKKRHEMAQSFRGLSESQWQGFCSRYPQPALPGCLWSAHLPWLLLILSAFLPDSRKHSWAVYNALFSDHCCLVPKPFVGSSAQAPCVILMLLFTGYVRLSVTP